MGHSLPQIETLGDSQLQMFSFLNFNLCRFAVTLLNIRQRFWKDFGEHLFTRPLGGVCISRDGVGRMKKLSRSTNTLYPLACLMNIQRIPKPHALAYTGNPYELFK